MFPGTGPREGCEEGHLRFREVKTLAQGHSASKRLSQDRTGVFWLQSGGPPAGSGTRPSLAPAALGPRVPVSLQPRRWQGLPKNVKARASPGNSSELSRGLYSGSQNIWPRIGRGRRGCGWPMPWLPVLPRCFLPIAEPSGLISDPGATGRTAPPTHTEDRLFWPKQELQGPRRRSGRAAPGRWRVVQPTRKFWEGALYLESNCSRVEL